MEIKAEEKFKRGGPLPENNPPRVTGGTPLFRHEEITEYPYFLDRLMRGILVRKGITREYFNEMWKRYAVNVLGLKQQQISSGKDNLMKALKHGRLTQEMFLRCLRVLQLELRDVEVDLVDISSNSTEDYRLSDLMFAEKANPQPQPSPKKENRGHGKNDQRKADK